jgi:RNA polymerase sigma factor (sigma-70 family)
MSLEFPQVYVDNYDPIARYLLRRQIRRALAEDIAQQTFTDAWQGRASYDPSRGTPRAWLFGIAAHLAAKHFATERAELRAYARAKSRELGYEDTFEMPLIDELDARQLSGPLALALVELSPRRFEVLTFTAWTSLSQTEIAAALGIKKDTVKPTLQAARERVQASLERSSRAAREKSRQAALEAAAALEEAERAAREAAEAGLEKSKQAAVEAVNLGDLKQSKRGGES